MKKIKVFVSVVRGLVIVSAERFEDSKIIQDIERWKKIYSLEQYSNKLALLILIANYKEFRNLYLYRNEKRRWYRRYLKIAYPPMETLYLYSREIGGGLFIQHGFSTMIAAERIGENCWINQQVTIGYNGKGRAPIIGNNVMITCGAKVLGEITIGDHVTIGANAVVIRDVESNTIVGGVPAKKLK